MLKNFLFAHPGLPQWQCHHLPFRAYHGGCRSACENCVAAKGLALVITFHPAPACRATPLGGCALVALAPASSTGFAFGTLRSRPFKKAAEVEFSATGWSTT